MGLASSMVEFGRSSLVEFEVEVPAVACRHCQSWDQGWDKDF